MACTVTAAVCSYKQTSAAAHRASPDSRAQDRSTYGPTAKERRWPGTTHDSSSLLAQLACGVWPAHSCCWLTRTPGYVTASQSVCWSMRLLASFGSIAVTLCPVERTCPVKPMGCCTCVAAVRYQPGHPAEVAPTRRS